MSQWLDFLNHAKPIKATVVAVRAAIGFTCRKLEEENKTAITAIREIKNTTVAMAKLLWLKSSTSRAR